MEQIAAMQQATQEVEEKLAQVTAELNAEREARAKEASQVKEEREEKEVKSLKEAKQTKETSSKNRLQKRLDKKSTVKEEKPKKKSLFSRKKEETSSSDSEDSEEEALCVCLNSWFSWLLCSNGQYDNCDLKLFVAPVSTPKIINLGDYSVPQLENLYQTMASVVCFLTI